MADRRAVLLGTALVTLIMVVSAMGLLSAFAAAPAAAPHTAATVGTTVSDVAGVAGAKASPAPTTPSLPSPARASSVTTAPNPVAVKALSVAKADGIPARDLYVPRAGASPTQIAQAQAAGHVSPLYGQYSPAPLGLAYYGLSANSNGNGSIVPTELNTSSVMATVDETGQGIQPNSPFDSSPDAYGIQLNSVTTNISLFGGGPYSFWTQNVVTYYAQLHEMVLISNVWNFSAGTISANVFYAHGLNGTLVAPEFYFSVYTIPVPVVYPFNLTLWMNNSLISGRNAVNFTVALSDPASPSATGVYNYDYVIFNSKATVSSPAAGASEYSANGYQYNAFGLTNDFEVILGGPGGGSQANLYAASANVTLQYWDATSSSYQSVPAAYSYGGETGETTTGAYVGWATNATTGAPYGVLSAGPGILQGLWNATGQEGVQSVTLSITPGNAFYFIGVDWASNFSYENDLYWAPQEMNGGVFWLAPGTYNLTIALSDFDQINTTFTVASAAQTITVSLTADAALGIYTPLYFWENSQFSALSTGGAGTPTSPYQIVNVQTNDLFLFDTTPGYVIGMFGLFNDYTFPVFTGVFTWGTTASVTFSDMPSLSAVMPYAAFPATDDLGYLFQDSSNVSLVNSTQISGWFTNFLSYGIGDGFYGNYYTTFSLVEWNSTNLLIANNTFLTQSGGMYMALGSNNTIWGNTFDMVAVPTSYPACSLNAGFCALNQSEGLQQTEGGDTIYNNAFNTAITAVEIPFNVYTSAFSPWENTWNITPTPAATINYATYFPDFPLTGTIIGNATQGGNFWWNYGYSGNPYGVLPYNNSLPTGVPYGQIFTGGDYYPLVLTVYSVVFVEGNLPSGTLWSVTVNSVTLYTTTTEVAFNEANGTYAWSIGEVSGWVPSVSSGTVTIAGAGTSFPVLFSAVVYAATFTETGLPAGTQWSVTIGVMSPTSTGTTLVFSLANGSYTYSAATAANGYTPLPTGGTLDVVGSPVSVNITYSAPPPPTYTVTFMETGLTTGTSWTVTLNGVTTPSATATITFQEPTGSYSYTVATVTGYSTPSPSSGTITVSGAAPPTTTITFTPTTTPTYAVTFTESGLTAGTSWSVTLNGVTTPSTTTTIVFTEAAGSYGYTVNSVTGFAANTTTGTVTVVAAAVGVEIGFTSTTPFTYAVTFTETGLPTGGTWTVTLAGTPKTAATGSTITFQEANSSAGYAFTITAVSGYSFSASPASVVVVSGAPASVTVTFSANGPNNPNGNSGLSTLDWVIIGAVIAIIIIALLVALAMRGRSGGGSKGQDDTSTEQGSGDNSNMDDGSSGGGSA